jgi:hypothetical protein
MPKSTARNSSKSKLSSAALSSRAFLDSSLVPGFRPPKLNAKAHHMVFPGVHAFPAAERLGAMGSRKISEEAGRELSHSSTMLSADIIEGMRICCRRPLFRTMGFEQHEAWRKIIREWMSLPKDKRQTEEQAEPGERGERCGRRR